MRPARGSHRIGRRGPRRSSGTGNRSPERLGDLSKVAQQPDGKAGLEKVPNTPPMAGPRRRNRRVLPRPVPGRRSHSHVRSEGLHGAGESAQTPGNAGAGAPAARTPSRGTRRWTFYFDNSRSDDGAGHQRPKEAQRPSAGTGRRGDRGPPQASCRSPACPQQMSAAMAFSL